MKKSKLSRIAGLATVCLSIFFMTTAFTGTTEHNNENSNIEVKRKSENRKMKFLSQWKASKEYTLELIDAMPKKDFNYKPIKVDTVRTFAQQMKHLGAIIYGMNSIFIKDEAPVAPDPDFENKGLSKEEIRAFITSSFDVVTETVSKMTEKELYEEREMMFMPSKPMLTKFEYLDFVRDHCAHHRGQVVSYLRANGITPPAYKYY